MRLTTLCYIEKDDSFLMLYRNKKEQDQSQGKWLGIGGKLDAGESPEDCVLREVYEETGLRLTEYSFRGVVTFISDCWEDELMFMFTASEFEGELTDTCNEGELSWINKDKLMDLSLWEGDRYFLQDLIDGKPLVNMKLTYEGDTLISCERYY
ncbi:MAG: 8-oxo-dGTP diphosphatase [Lachnospiraceae bacterium]|nr:8-oxo-dGTP diphosphatase [Lachnospiraceae bacterium]MBR3599200.1 8-oxo-dGTP diphosphatase [Lachnospiraceae bacterium]